jgi:hypothetical protein
MKRLLMVLVIMLFLPMVVSAAPFIKSDPYLPTEVQPTSFVLVIDGGSPISVVPVAGDVGATGLILKYDVGGVTVGSHTVRVKACVNDPAWGEACSAEVPFTFTKPVAPSMKTISLSK